MRTETKDQVRRKKGRDGRQSGKMIANVTPDLNSCQLTRSKFLLPYHHRASPSPRVCPPSCRVKVPSITLNGLRSARAKVPRTSNSAYMLYSADMTKYRSSSHFSPDSANGRLQCLSITKRRSTWHVDPARWTHSHTASPEENQHFIPSNNEQGQERKKGREHSPQATHSPRSAAHTYPHTPPALPPTPLSLLPPHSPKSQHEV